MSLYQLKEKIILILFLTVSFSYSTVAETEAPDFYSVEWNERITKVDLPKPFGKVSIFIKKSEENLKAIELLINGEKIKFNNKLLDGISSISDPSFSYGKADFDKDQKINSFDIFFEYGNLKIINLGEVPGCESPCIDSVRDIITFTVDKNYEISRKFIPMELGEKGSKPFLKKSRGRTR